MPEDPASTRRESYLALSVGESNIDEAAGVELPLVGAALGGLLLLLGLDLYSALCVSLEMILERKSRGFEPWGSAT